MSAFKIIPIHDEKFELRQDDKLAGYLDYHQDTQKFYLDYVFVAPEMRGQKVGQIIVTEAIRQAQAKNLHAEPICGYARAIMQKNNWPEQFKN